MRKRILDRTQIETTCQTTVKKMAKTVGWLRKNTNSRVPDAVTRLHWKLITSARGF